MVSTWSKKEEAELKGGQGKPGEGVKWRKGGN